MKLSAIQSKAFFLAICFSLLSTPVLQASTLPARLSANGYASDYTVGQADLMLSLQGDDTHNLFVDPNVSYASDNQGYADVGLGYRWISNQAAIVGVYLFGGYTRIENNARLWVANPGVELLGSRWDAHLNGYVPFGDRNYAFGDGLGSAFGFNTISFAVHSEYDEFIHADQHVGEGADIKLGYQLLPESSIKAYVGSYFFRPSDTPQIWGGAAGMEYWLDNHAKLFAAYTYDNVRHSTVAFGLGVEWGGSHRHRINPSLAERLTDPVDRYLAQLGHGSKIPTRNRYLDLGPRLIFSDVAFFSQSGTPNNGGMGLTLANCTLDNPCGPTDLTDAGASQLNSLLPNTRMYFNGGQYNAQNVPGGANAVSLQPGQSIHSRSVDYTQPASDSQRSVFNGGFILSDGNLLNRIILNSSAGILTGVAVTGENNSITNSIIGRSSLFDNGIVANSSSSILVDNSSINAFNTGINATSGSLVAIDGSTILAGSRGVIANSSLVDLDNSTISVISFNGVGITANNTANVTVVNSTVSVKGDDSILVPSSIGVIADSSIVNIKKSTIEAKADVSSVGLRTQGTDPLIEMDGNSIIVNGFFLTTAIKRINAGEIIIQNTNCIQNGKQVSC